MTEPRLVAHIYVSTSCLHGLHGRCQIKGARCKFCSADCVCPCHKTEKEPDEG